MYNHGMPATYASESPETPKTEEQLIVVSEGQSMVLDSEGNIRVGDGGLVQAVLSYARGLGKRLPWVAASAELLEAKYKIGDEEFHHDLKNFDGAGPLRLKENLGSEDDPVISYQVVLTKDEKEAHYGGLANSFLWPFMHGTTLKQVAKYAWKNKWIRISNKVQDRYAEVIDKQAKVGATVWIHDYQLALLPGKLRHIRRDLKIGYFHHIPFPKQEFIKQESKNWNKKQKKGWKRICKGLLGSSYIGFHTYEYAENYVQELQRLKVIDSYSESDGKFSFSFRGRTIQVGVNPIGIDPERYENAAKLVDLVDAVLSGEVTEAALESWQADSKEELENLVKRARSDDKFLTPNMIREMLRDALPDAKKNASPTILLSVERLDYTKGIEDRLLSFEKALDDGLIDPADVRLVQIAPSSRGKLDEYKALSERVFGLVERITQKYPGSVTYIQESQDLYNLASWYRAADVMVVTPHRDGMNLVSKEYIGCRYNNTGELILSEGAGAAEALTEATKVQDPSDHDTFAKIMAGAVLRDQSLKADHDIVGEAESITKSEAEHSPYDEAEKIVREEAMIAMREKVNEHDVAGWAGGNLEDLRNSEQPQLTDSSQHQVNQRVNSGLKL